MVGWIITGLIVTMCVSLIYLNYQMELLRKCFYSQRQIADKRGAMSNELLFQQTRGPRKKPVVKTDLVLFEKEHASERNMP
jgi:hypothetical protein